MVLIAVYCDPSDITLLLEIDSFEQLRAEVVVAFGASLSEGYELDLYYHYHLPTSPSKLREVSSGGGQPDQEQPAEIDVSVRCQQGLAAFLAVVDQAPPVLHVRECKPLLLPSTLLKADELGEELEEEEARKTRDSVRPTSLATSRTKAEASGPSARGWSAQSRALLTAFTTPERQRREDVADEPSASKITNLIVSFEFDPPTITLVGPLKAGTLQHLNELLPRLTAVSNQNCRKKDPDEFELKTKPMKHWSVHLRQLTTNEISRSGIMLAIMDALDSEGGWVMRDTHVVTQGDHQMYTLFFRKRLALVVRGI